MQTNYRAAWVPDDDPQRDWEVAAALAVDWVEAESASQGSSAVLVTNALGVEESVPSLVRFSRRHTRTAPRAGRGRVPPGVGPVLAYVPTADSLAFAMRLARGSSLCVVEGGLFPVRGWAAQVRAADLAHPGGEPAALDPLVAEAVERLRFYGNNGYSTPFDRRAARSVVDALRRDGHLDADQILAAVAAAGVSPRGIRRLAELIAPRTHR